MLPHRNRILFILVLSLICLVQIDSRTQKRRRSLSRRPTRSAASGNVNILFVRSTTVDVGFRYVQGAKRFFVSAREWINGDSIGNEAFSVWLRDQDRTTTLRNLIPGRDYVILVQAWGQSGKVGLQARKVVRTSQQCYVCNGKPSNKACQGVASVFECPHDKDACLNEVRYSKGVPKITKRCAQWRPELGKQIQNGKDITRACSGKENIKDVACKCMCRSNLCNEVETPCLNECFKELPTPDNSYLRCTDTEKVGSVCRWFCMPGFKIQGRRASECRPDRTWSVLNPPQCVPAVGAHTPNHVCPILEPPENSYMSCTDENNPASVCNFACLAGYRREGSSERKCDASSSSWSGEQPICAEIKCTKIEEIDGLSKECTNNETIGSECEFTCPITRKFVGKSTLKCLSTGRWSSSIPRCTAPDCTREPKTFANVVMECDNIPGRKTGRVCQFSCKEGYVRKGATNSFCYKGNSWTNNSPTCKRVMCYPQMYAPASGFVRCSDRNYFESKCVFTCMDGYMLRGRDSSTCGIGGKWSMKSAPTCKKIKCEPLEKFNGFVSCNSGMNFGSVCRFKCKTGFGLPASAAPSVKCVAKTPDEVEVTKRGGDLGKWNGPIPRCVVVGCPKLGAPPDHSTVKCTGPQTSLGTICTYSCDKGYKLNGSARTICQTRSDGSSSGHWSSPPPVCERIKCEILPELLFGAFECTDDFYVGSKCTANCDYGRFISGRQTVTCNSKASWTSKLGSCRVVTCSGKPALKNGDYKCGGLENKFNFNHECQASCDAGFELSIPGAAVCGIRGNWLTSEEVFCKDVNECVALNTKGETTNGGCEQTCVNTIGAYRCECLEDYQLKSDGKSCRVLICPSLETVMKGKVACTNTNKLTSVCNLRCIPGFETSGVERVTCLKSGKWNEKIGTCTRISCPAVEIPKFGFMECSLGYKFGSNCDFECKPGYELRGKPSIRCGADGEWTAHVPTCQQKTCDPEVLSLTNGVMKCSDKNRFESICEGSCDVGYELVMDESTVKHFTARLQCTEDGTWSESKPVCTKKRCEPTFEQLIDRRQQSIITCTDDDLLGSSCELSCMKGYQVIGNHKIKCIRDATWNKRLGICTKIECPTLTPPSNSQMTCTENSLYKSTCSFFCNEGYEMDGYSQTGCSHDRTWTNKPPTCAKIKCIQSYLKLLKGSVKCTDESYFDSKCTYRCDPGYEFADTTTDIRKSFGAGLDEGVTYDIIRLSCLATGRWGGEKPTCQRHECVPPSVVMREAEQYGTIQCSNGDKFESVCELSCHKGYEVAGGRASTQCMDNRNWKPKLGKCTRVRCPMFEPLVNGAVQCDNANFYESRCLFGCYPGYKLIGSPESHCLADRTFTKTAPTCEKIECPTTHTKLMHGSATCSDGVRFESECVYVCDPGYEMLINGQPGTEESVVLKCEAFEGRGVWGGKLPTCTRKQCSVHDGAIAKARLNGIVKCSERFWYQSVCTVECNPGYQLIGPAKTRCTANADWAPPLGYCERRTCPKMKSPRHGSMDCTNENKFQSICHFKCDYGYELVGSKESQCLAMEFFSSVAPTCREIVCSVNFLKLPDGEVECSDRNKLDSRCSYKCNEGYQLTSRSPDTVECLDTHQWNGIKPKCEKKVCPQGEASLVRAAEFGTLTCTDANKYLSVCSVVCYPGYELTQGIGSMTCQSDQEWAPQIGYCTKITCEEFEPLDNGKIECTDSLRYESVCSFSCEPGFELTHNKSSTCQSNRKFSEAPPECKPVTCPSWHMRVYNGESHCTDGNNFGSVCTYLCNKGFERVSGSSIAQCLADRTWDGQKTGCERIYCDGSDILFVKAKETGEVACTSHYAYGSVCKLKCNDGFELTGLHVGEASCNEFAQWDGELGYCTRILCDKFEAPNNGNVSCTDDNHFESECVFICHTGYEMDGESRTTCQADRTWTNKEPRCKKIECSQDNLFLENGSANCTERNRYLSVCWYGCDPGYEMDEDASYAMCTSSRAWTRNKPSCVKRVCDYDEEMITKALQNGEITCTDGVRYQSVCSLKCNEGYELDKGKGKIECTHSTTWDKEIGECEKSTCERVKVPDNTKMECTDSNRFESICTFVCDDGYELEGNPEIECLSNKTFSDRPPACVKATCPPEHLTLPFGTVDCTDNALFMSICTYECLVGFRIYADDVEYPVKSECKSDQTWSFDIPICEKVTCPYNAPHLLRAEENGVVTCTEANRYQSECTLGCDIGFQSTGYEKTTCTERGRWSNPIGNCQRIQCDTLSTPSSAVKTCTDEEFFNSSCSLSCKGGYTFSSENFMMEDEITVTCSATRTWTQPSSPPECIKSKCPKEFLTVMNGNISCSDGNLYGSQCLLKCDEGYELVNPSDDFDVTTVILTCLANASWDMTLQPYCKKVKCEKDMIQHDEAMLHGKIKCNDASNFQSKCELTCNKGYHVFDGVESTECLADRTWEPMLGRCDKNSCPPLVAPEHSTLQCENDFKFKSKCKVICQPGFEIYDPENDYDETLGLECKADGDWCGDPPSCTRIKCPMESLSLDGGVTKCSDENLFESKCFYICNPGYQMKQGDHDVTICTAHKTWSHPTPTCEKRRCPANDTSMKEARVRGEVICSDENKFDSFCELQCPQGFELSGENETSCLHTGKWSNGIGLCNKIRCEEPSVPWNAIVKCSDNNRYESFCTFECREGYMLTEKSVKDGNGIVCQTDGTWDGEVIQCEKITCEAEGYTRIDNGLVHCNDSNYFMSRCLFECDGGHELEDPVDLEDPASAVVNCTETGFWDVPSPPKCKPVQCDSTEILQELLENGAVRCSSGSEFQSRCKATCFDGYELVGGEAITFCSADKNWGPKLGTCQKISCSELKIPRNGRMVCDDEFKYMSQCVFDCLAGYEMRTSGKNQGTTTCRADGSWMGRIPTCEPKKCDRSYFRVKRGQVLCTNRNYFESECEFKCDEGYELSGPNLRLATCKDDGNWNIEKPSCNKKTCQSAYATNGFMNCTGSEFNSECILTCEIGHILSGAERSTCVDMGRSTKWMPPLGKCEKVSCEAPPATQNGVIQCSDGNRFRSECSVKCERGYKVKGNTFSTRCLPNGKWMNDFPTCESVTCDSSYLDVEYGSVMATNTNLFESALKYSCPSVGYKFTGPSEVICLENGKWNRQKPNCQRITCPPTHLPNGEVVCSGKRHNDYQSRCSYSCHENYELIGSASTRCKIDGKWTSPPPYCKGHCDIKLSPLAHGRSECTNYNYHHSRCTFSCNSYTNSHYTLHGNDFLTCKNNGRWDGVPPCCARSCLPHGKMDLFFAFHSSANIRYESWRKLLDFAAKILDNFEIGDDNVLAGALRFHRDVDSTNEIPIGKIKNKADLQRAIRFIQLGGWGTNTGKALQHILTTSINHPGNRPDVMDSVILFVGDTSDDDVITVAKKLKSYNITVYVVGIQNTAKKLDCDQLIGIASSPVKDHLSIVQGGFTRFTSELSKIFAQQLCRNPCIHDREYWNKAGSYIVRDENVEGLDESDFLI